MVHLQVSQENINSLADASFQFFNSPSSSSASSVCGDDDDTQLENVRKYFGLNDSSRK